MHGGGDIGAEIRDGRRHPLHRAVRLLLLILSVAGLWLGLREAAATIEAIRVAGPVVAPDDDVELRRTLLGAVGEALVTLDFEAGIAAALDEEDFQRATLLRELASTTGVELGPDTLRRYEAAMRPTAVLARSARDCAAASLTGWSGGPAGIVCAVGTDLLVPLYADGRDLAVQLGRWTRGSEVDPLILGLSAAGLATAWALPAGDVVKAALRSRHLDEGLRITLRRQPLRAGAELAAIVRHGGWRTGLAALRAGGDLGHLTLYRRSAAVLGRDAETAIAIVGRRLPALFRTWHLTGPLLARLLLAGSLASLAATLLLAIIAQDVALRAARRLGLRWLARQLTARAD